MATYFLILLGGTVRSTGAGMGCPDWPKCFGRWMPPTGPEQLPDNYKAIYSSYRNDKNVQFAKYLSWVGAQRIADRILTDKSILETSDFNATKTWTEYVNRLVGVVVGFLILLLFLLSFNLRKRYRGVFILSFIVLLTVLLQGWFGSIVVSTNLTSWTITVHLFLALLIVALLLLLVDMTSSNEVLQKTATPSSAHWVLGGCMMILLIQIFLGTTVRGEVDKAASVVPPGKAWVTYLGNTFRIHRSFSWVLLLLHAVLLYTLRKTTTYKRLSGILLALTAVALISGAGMVYWGVPLFLVQPLHLFLAAILFGLQWRLFYRLNLCFKFGVQYSND